MFRPNKHPNPGRPRDYDFDSTPPPPISDHSVHNSLRSSLRESVQALSHRRITRQQVMHRQAGDRSPSTMDPKNLSNNRVSTASSSPALNRSIDSKSSSTSVRSMVSTVESRIDVEHAIGLLQELKMTATPEELVALHRALLPVKEASPTPSPQLPSIEEHAYTSIPPARKRSVIPPGLATRSGEFEDVLRRQYEASPTAQSSSRNRRDTWDRSSPPQHHHSPIRASTPSSQHCHAGAFQAGTLRIMNGSASPAPSIISKVAAEFESVDEEKEATAAWTTDGQPKIDELINFDAPQSTEAHSVQPLSASDVSPARGQSRAKVQLQLDVVLQRQSYEQSSPYPVNNQQRGFQHQIDQRAAHLSQEYMSDCEITSSPYEERHGFLNLVKSFSAIEDDTPESTTSGNDARRDTLSRLTGQDEISASQTGGRITQFPPYHVVHEKDSGYSSDVPSTPQKSRSLDASATQEAPYFAQPSLLSAEEHNNNRVSSTNEAASLYTFEEMVNSLSHVEPDATPSPTIRVKRSPLSIFKAKSKKHSKSIQVTDRSNTLPDSNGRGSSSSNTISVEGADSCIGKQARKLQKPMPEYIRRQRVSTLESVKPTQLETSHIDHRSSSATEDAVQLPFQRHLPSVLQAQTESKLVPSSDESAEGPNERGSESSWRKRSKTITGRGGKPIVEAKEEGRQPEVTGSIRKRSKSVPDINAPILHSSFDGVLATGNWGTDSATSYEVGRALVDHDFRSVAEALTSDPSRSQGQMEPGALRRPSMSQRRYTAHPVQNDGNHSSSTEVQATRLDHERHTPVLVTNASASQSLPPSPLQHGLFNATTTPVAVGSSLSVEDRFPGWQGKPAVMDASTTTPSWVSQSSESLHLKKSRITISEAVPPVPELPADIAYKVVKADQMVAKKLRLSPRSSLNGSARSSVDSFDQKQAVARKAKNVKGSREASQAAFDQLTVTAEEDESPKAEGMIEQRWSIDGSILLPRAQAKPQTTSPTHDSQHPGWPSWEQQSKMWRERREAIALLVKQDHDTPEGADAAANPSLPVLKFSRYITPVGAHQQGVGSSDIDLGDDAEKFAQSYTDLIGDENIGAIARPGYHRTDSVFSSGPITTTTTTTTVTISRSSSSDTRPSGSREGPTPPQHAYSRTRSEHSQVQRQINALQSGHSRFSRLERRSAEVERDSVGSFSLAQRPDLQQKSSESVLDRFSGGLKYGWSPGAGFGGSAGTVTSNALDASNRKSVQMSEEFGLDLSDIPVFLQRNSFTRTKK